MSELQELYKQIEHCQDCALGKYRTKAVPGEGLETAEIMFIGEAPGWNEDQQGRPFVGAAGLFLTSLLASIGLNRSQVYIANVIKCRPPGNRDPLPGEIQACSQYLEKQIALIKPKMIVTLGRYSMARYFPNETIGKIHGTAKEINGITYFAMYHPAAALHQANLKSTIEADMLKIPDILSKLRKERKEDTAPKAVEPEQKEKLLARQEEKILIETRPAPVQLDKPTSESKNDEIPEEQEFKKENKKEKKAEEQKLPENKKQTSDHVHSAVNEKERPPDALEPKQLNLF